MLEASKVLCVHVKVLVVSSLGPRLRNYTWFIDNASRGYAKLGKDITDLGIKSTTNKFNAWLTRSRSTHGLNPKDIQSFLDSESKISMVVLTVYRYVKLSLARDSKPTWTVTEYVSWLSIIIIRCASRKGFHASRYYDRLGFNCKPASEVRVSNKAWEAINSPVKFCFNHDRSSDVVRCTGLIQWLENWLFVVPYF